MDTIISSLFSGLVATGVTLFVTHLIQKKREKYNYKVQLFRDLIAYRTDIVPNSNPTGNFQKAVNQVFIAYNDCPKVLEAYETFRKNVMYKDNTRRGDEKIIDNLVALLKVMAAEIRVDYSFSNDDLFTKPVIIGMPHVNAGLQNIPGIK